MPWPLLKWIIYSSSSSSSSSEDYEDEEECASKKTNDHFFEPNNKKKIEQINDEEKDSQENDDFSYEPQEEETNSSDYTFTVDEPRRKRRRIDNKEFSPNLMSFKRSRKRVWSKEDEFELLKNFLDYRTRPRMANESPSFYNEVNPKFKSQFTKQKLAEKIARLKKKYKNVVKKMMNSNGQEFRFRNPHDSAIFDISQKIWAESPICNFQEKNVVADSHDVGSSKTPFEGKHGDHDDDDDEGNGDVREMIIGLAMNPIPLSLSNYGGRGGDVADEKWREQQILELEAYSRRLELIQQQVKGALDDLRSK